MWMASIPVATAQVSRAVASGTGCGALRVSQRACEVKGRKPRPDAHPTTVPDNIPRAEGTLPRVNGVVAAARDEVVVGLGEHPHVGVVLVHLFPPQRVALAPSVLDVPGSDPHYALTGRSTMIGT